MLFKKLRLVFVLGLFGLGLLACGDSDTGPAEKPAAMVQSEGVSSSLSNSVSNGAVAAYDPDVPSMMVEDNGVVSEEEIYKNWPEEAATASDDSAITEEAEETIAAGSDAAKTHTVFGQATVSAPTSFLSI